MTILKWDYLITISAYYFLPLIIKLIMITNTKCDLPKVRLKFKTQPSQNINQSIQIPRFYKHDASPSIFLERIKMTKEMHEAFMRYRRLKKHNYIKNMVNPKKNISATQCKKMETINIKNKTASFHNKLQIALESSFERRYAENESQGIRRSKLYSLNHKNKESKQDLERNDDIANLKPQTLSLKPKKMVIHHLNLQSSTVNAEAGCPELEGMRGQYDREEQKGQKMIKFLKKTKRQLKATRGSSSFLIEAWKEDKILAGASYYLKNQFDHHNYF